MAAERASVGEGIALTLSVLAVLYLGILPNHTLTVALQAAQALLK